MKRPATIFELIGGILTIVIAVITIASTTFSKIEAAAKLQENHELRIKQLERESESFRNEYKADIKELKQGQQEILILLQNKQDRK